MNLHPQVIGKEGRREFVVLPYEEFLKLKEALEDYEDLRDLRNAKAESAVDDTVSLDEAKRMFSESTQANPRKKADAGNGG